MGAGSGKTHEKFKSSLDLQEKTFLIPAGGLLCQSMQKPALQNGTIEVAGSRHSYTLRRSAKARRISIRILAGGMIEVVVPRWASYYSAAAALRRQEKWLARMLPVQRSRQDEIPRRQLKDGELLPYFGRAITLRLRLESDRRRTHVDLRDESVIVCIGPDHDLRVVLRVWYRRQALRYMTAKVRQMEGLIRKKVTSIRIMEASTRWGSCNAKARSMSFNWRLALAPEAILTYVIAHEMAHLAEANHSRKFWALVQSLDGNALLSRRWLKRYGHTLAW